MKYKPTKPYNTKKVALTAGFTLVEIMVAIAVSGTLITIILQIFLSNRLTYNTIDALSEIQEDARIAVIFLSRDARQLSHQGCSSSSNIALVNNVDLNGDSVADDISNSYDDSKQVLSNNNASSLSIDGKAVIAGSDTIRFQYGNSCGGQLVSNMNSDADSIKISDQNQCSLSANDLFMITDCQSADIVATASASDSSGVTTIGHGTKNISTKLSKRYLDNAEVLLLRSNHYYLSNNADGIVSLMRFDGTNSIELVTGVENMQILLGEDTNNNGVANRYLVAGTPSLQMSRVVNLQISLLLSTTDEVASKSLPTLVYPPAPFNAGSGSTYTPSDKKIYKVFNMNIALRNQLN